MAVATVVAAAGTVVTTAFTGALILSAILQWDAALDGIEQTREALLIDQQPWVYVKDMRKASEFSPLSDGRVVVTYVNSGRTPAMDVEGICSLAFIHKDDALKYDPKVTAARTYSGVMGPDQVLMSDLRPPEDAGTRLPIVTEASHNLYVVGALRYRDIFKTIYCSQFCYSAIPIFGPRTAFQACEEHNSIEKVEKASDCPVPERAQPTPPPTP